VAGEGSSRGEGELNQPNVLIISDDADFPRMLLSRWQSERVVPAFTVMSSDLWNGTGNTSYEIAIVGPIRGGRLSPVLKSLDAPARPTLCVAEDGAMLQTLRDQHPRTICLQQLEGWLDSLVLIGSEAIKRVEAQCRTRKAEQAAAVSNRYAVLGRYMLEMRHNINNALTSVLGNAELLLLEPESFSEQMRDQLETIHTMSLRIHETLQRFSSMDSEMQFAEKESHGETGSASQVAGAGN
jgi:signal transduction histidine kinase